MVTSIIKRLISLFPFILSSFLISALLFIALKAIISNYDHQIMLDTLNNPYELYIIKFNLFLASITSLFTIMLSIPIARALHKREKFFGRSLIINLMNICFALPTITLILGIIIIHGKNGWINHVAQFIFGTSFNHYLYGIFGTIIGCLTFSLPLATRLFLNNLEKIPAETWRLSSQLNFSQLATFKYIEWPAIRSIMASVAVLTFIMCFTNFIIILSLGGGPAVNTLEVAIYQAIKMDFNLPKAAVLSLIQLSICLTLLLLAYKANLNLPTYSHTKARNIKRLDTTGLLNRLNDFFFISVLVLISVLPVISIIYKGMNEKLISVIYSDKFLYCLKQSLLISTYSAILTVTLALSLVSGAFYARYHLGKPKLAEAALILSNARMIIPAFILITGLFLVLNDITFVMNHAFYLLILMSAVAALPFATNILWSGSLSFSNNEINLCRNLNINYLNFVTLIYYPKIKRDLGYALSFSMAISWGDLSIISLFSSQDINTLPYLLYNALNSYRLEEAITLSLIMILVSFFFFWVIDEFYNGDNNVRA